MLPKEDVDSWNKLFPDCQINESNLKQPTEHFLTVAFVCYLRRFGFCVEPPFSLNNENKENNKENRLFLIKLSRQIDHFLKITDKSYAFTYYDLIRPTTKKTAQILYILLNYYFYYNLYKEKVFEMTGHKIRNLEDFKSMIEDARRDDEHRKEEAINMKSTIDELMEENRLDRKKLIELNEKKSLQEEEFQKLNNGFQEHKEKYEHLEEQKKTLRKRLVSDQELLELKNKLQSFQSELAEQHQLIQKSSDDLKESKESSAELLQLSKIIENAREIVPLQLIEQFKEVNRKLEKTQKEKHKVDAKQNLMLQEIEEETKALKSLEEQQKILKLDHEKKEKELTKILQAKQNLLKEKNDKIVELEMEDHVLDCQLEEEKDISGYLNENIQEIMSAYEN